ncbi:hypothetical protein CAPTEDRAFT_197948 [Capitella teleta]|uniref:Uncharacterized protein n=1 Tax=Capitella teleta TaxID=283909 RepID=R7UCL9_CAPTE|nr:hypothetical protein CAPTEDRAFT_197948 [Capitella teleta]|eukprot:ELU01528.1 hypothetical protein CAPTEDRAFT_197948 [Capitella teleta]
MAATETLIRPTKILKAKTTHETVLALAIGGSKPATTLVSLDLLATAIQDSELPAMEAQYNQSKREGLVPVQWGIYALTIIRGLVKLKEAVQQPSGAVCIKDLHHPRAVISSGVTIMFAHTVRMMASVFNKHSVQRQIKIAMAASDHHLSRWVEESEASVTDLVAEDMEASLEAPIARCTDGLFIVVFQATTSRPASSKGNRSDPNIYNVYSSKYIYGYDLCISFRGKKEQKEQKE